MNTDPVPYTVPKRKMPRRLRLSLSYADIPPCKFTLALERWEVQFVAMRLVEFLGSQTDETFDLTLDCEVKNDQA